MISAFYAQVWRLLTLENDPGANIPPGIWFYLVALDKSIHGCLCLENWGTSYLISDEWRCLQAKWPARVFNKKYHNFKKEKIRSSVSTLNAWGYCRVLNQQIFCTFFYEKKIENFEVSNLIQHWIFSSPFWSRFD